MGWAAELFFKILTAFEKCSLPVRQKDTSATNIPWLLHRQQCIKIKIDNGNYAFVYFYKTLWTIEVVLVLRHTSTTLVLILVCQRYELKMSHF